MEEEEEVEDVLLRRGKLRLSRCLSRGIRIMYEEENLLYGIEQQRSEERRPKKKYQSALDPVPGGSQTPCQGRHHLDDRYPTPEPPDPHLYSIP